MNNKNDSMTSKAQQMSNGVANRESKTQKSIDISGEISRTVASLQSDFRSLDTRVAALEQLSKNQRSQSLKRVTLFHMSPALVAFLLIWPFVAIRITNRLSNK